MHGFRCATGGRPNAPSEMRLPPRPSSAMTTMGPFVIIPAAGPALTAYGVAAVVLFQGCISLNGWPPGRGSGWCFSLPYQRPDRKLFYGPGGGGAGRAAGGGGARGE